MLSFRTASLVAIVLCVVFAGISHPHFADNDFVTHYRPAAEALAQSHDIFLGTVDVAHPPGGPVFVNIPIVGYLFLPFTVLPVMVGAYIFLALGIAAAYASWRVLARQVSHETGRALGLLFLVNGPLIYSLKEGNTSQFSLLLVALAFLYLGRSRDVLAGALFAAAGILKPFALIVGGYFVLRGRWRVVAGGVLMLGTVAALSLLVFGWAAHVTWIERVYLPFSGRAVAAFNNQSLDAFLIRLKLGTGHEYDWSPYALGDAVSALRIILLLAIAGIVLGVTLRAPAADPRLVASLFLACGMVVSPISWAHYYCLLLPAWAFYLDTPSEQRTPWADAIMACGIALASLPVASMADGSMPIWNLIESLTLAGGVLTIAALQIVILKQAALAQGTTSMWHVILGHRHSGIAALAVVGCVMACAAAALSGAVATAN